jgi:FKBP-type peptidyl-prolyl cis-trans isomerase FkpA
MVFLGAALLVALVASSAQMSPAAEPPPIVTSASGLRLQVLRPGTGRRPQPGDAVQVTYEARLADGTLIDAAREPAGLPVSGLIPGFTEALQLMNQGGQYRFWVPPALAYGTQGVAGAVPPNAELVFTLTLLRVGPPALR